MPTLLDTAPSIVGAAHSFLGAIVFLSSPPANSAQPPSTAGDRPPNVIFIISDDQTYTDFGFMGNDQVSTPHLDALAAKSARFPNGYVPTSVCSPSLATLLTGLFPHQHGIHYNHPPPGNSRFNRMTSAAEYVRVRSQAFQLIKALGTLPRWLGDASYRSFQSGKFWEGHFSNAGFSEGMTLFRASPEPAFGNRTLDDGSIVAHGNGDAGLTIGRTTMAPVLDFIDRNAHTPFFVWYAPFLPHQPHDSPRRFYDRYKGSSLPENQIPYYACIAHFDETVGTLVDHIESRGLTDETLFVFVVDNGWEAGTKRNRKRPEEFDYSKRSKRSPFERGIRTPLLLCWDGAIDPREDTRLCSSVDLIPTVLKLSGIEAPDGLPGHDLLSPPHRPDRPICGAIYPGDASTIGDPGRDVAYRWVRQGDYKLIVPHRQNGKAPWGGYLHEESLYDVVADPDETTNLLTSPEHAAAAARLRLELDTWWNPGP